MKGLGKQEEKNFLPSSCNSSARKRGWRRKKDVKKSSLHPRCGRPSYETAPGTLVGQDTFSSFKKGSVCSSDALIIWSSSHVRTKWHLSSLQVDTGLVYLA